MAEFEGFKSLPLRPAGEPAPERIAAVDLGSNTFHVLVARLDAGEPRVQERLKYRVALAAGLEADGTLRASALEEALAALVRIADRLGGIERGRIRAVGTSALRSLRDPRPFLEAAERILGVPVRIVSGEEEAHLVFTGAAETLPETRRRRLVIDIGGGSTEFALGTGHAADQVASIPLGCVGVSRRAFAAGAGGEGVMRRALDEARQAVLRADLEPFVAGAPVLGDREEVVGTSGTVESVRNVLRALGWIDRDLTQDSLQRLAAHLAAAERLPGPLPGLDRDKEDVLPGGLAILVALCERLAIERLEWTEGALQDGLLRELVPLPEEGLRLRSLAALQERFSVDVPGADRVRRVVAALAAGARATFDLQPEHLEALDAAAALHGVGMAVSWIHHERHGAWLLRHAELRGFRAEERALLIALVRGQRGAWPQLAFKALDVRQRPAAQVLCVLLRLAVILESLDVAGLPELVATPEAIVLRASEQWCSLHPWVCDALLRECGLLASSAVTPTLRAEFPCA
ncbi:MAG: Ppx/GppA phosphatase family protein [Pseudomonadales bacterium]|jgi:exopolyphosphatase/guanosine-5'-triphosphate,3'-diphosphate pyrophosphatase|nr:Ppx/GppA phosphatase family protein [Pseudomonadales bacterium]